MPADAFRDLIRRAQARDRQAMDQLLAQVRADLHWHARRYATVDQPDASASDLVQNTCLHAWQKLTLFECGPDDPQTVALFRAWMIRILHRVGLNVIRFRSAQRRKPPRPTVRLGKGRPDSSDAGPEPVAPCATPSSLARTGEETHLLRRALENLPHDLDRTIVSLRFFEGLSLRQVAERLQLSPDKVRERCHFTLRRLQRELGELS
jgi:RNA polymerase sigma factor (sigma-70 family)